MAARRQRWGDTLDDDEVSGTVTGALPPNQVTQQGNVKTVVEYYRNDKGEIIKKTTRSKVVNVEKKVYKVGLL
jgi:translation initiation factor 3 subunit G